MHKLIGNVFLKYLKICKEFYAEYLKINNVECCLTNVGTIMIVPLPHIL